MVLFISYSIWTPQGAYSLAFHWHTELINWQCPHCPHCTFILLWYEGAVEMDLPKAPIMTDSASIWIHDLLICRSVPYPNLQQWPLQVRYTQSEWYNNAQLNGYRYDTHSNSGITSHGSITTCKIHPVAMVYHTVMWLHVRYTQSLLHDITQLYDYM